MFVLKIDTGNAVFHDDCILEPEHVHRPYVEHAELARILREIATTLEKEAYSDSGNVAINGNFVGSWELGG